MPTPQFDRSPIQFDWVQDHEEFVDYEAEINGLRLRLTWRETTARWELTKIEINGQGDEFIPDPNDPQIHPCETDDSHRTHSLPATMTWTDISNRLGFHPNQKDDSDKVKYSWGFTIDGKQCAIWDYKGARWSAYDPHGVLGRVFPEVSK